MQHHSALTFHTIRYLFHTYSDKKIYECNSPDDVKKLVWDRIKPILQDKKDEESFIKGIKLCDFNAIYEWISEHKEQALLSDCTSNTGGRLTEKPSSFKTDAPPTAIGGGDGNEEAKDGGGKDDAFSPHPLFGSDAVSGQ